MINELIDFLRRSPKFYIQTHDFPDADAVASAFALRNLFLQRGFIPIIVYAGEIQTPTLMSMIERLQIPLVFSGDPHWNEAGNAYVAEILTPFIYSLLKNTRSN